MKIRFAAILLAAAALAVGGCMQVENNAVIEKDGSGTLTLQISMSQEVAQALQDLKELGGDAAKDVEDMPDITTLSKQDLEKDLAGKGCKVTEFANEVSQDGKRTIRMSVAFKDLDGLSAAMASMAGNEALRIYRRPDGNYLLVAESSPEDSEEESEAEEETPDPAASMENMAKTMEIMGKLMAHAGEMSVKTSITLPGDIVESNATRTEGRTAYWQMDASTMMSDQDMSPRVVFSGKGVKIDAPVKE